MLVCRLSRRAHFPLPFYACSRRLVCIRHRWSSLEPRECPCRGETAHVCLIKKEFSRIAGVLYP